MLAHRPHPHADYNDRPIQRQSLPSSWIERAGTARLSTDGTGMLFIACTVHDERFAHTLTTIPIDEYRMDVAATSVAVSSGYAQIARALVRRYFANVIEE
jgi:hypothetical protein